MGLLLSPVIANFFMGDFDKKAIELRIHNPACWFRYVDDTFVIWSHGLAKLKDFLIHLNELHNKIQFTIEKRRRPPPILGH
jgi:hypothetical protein